MKTTNITIDSFSDLAPYKYDAITIKLSLDNERLLSNIISLCTCSKLRTLDICDNVYSFIVNGDFPFDIEDENEDENGNIIKNILHFDKKQSVWKVTVGECFFNKKITRFASITNVTYFDGYNYNVYFITNNSDTVTDRYYQIEAQCEGILNQIYNKVADILNNKNSIDEYNASLDKIIPSYRKVYYVQRNKLNSYKLLNKDADDSNIDILKGILAKKLNYESTSCERNVNMTPAEYMKLWSIAHYYSYNDINEKFEVDPFEYFYNHNNKGDELLEVIKQDEKAINDAAVLDKWIRENSCYHCLDVIYARTHLFVRGDTVLYSNATSYFTNEFLYSLIKLSEICDDKLHVSSADTLLNMLNGEDYVRFVPSYADKYLRDYRDDIKCYQESRYYEDSVSEIEKLASITENDYCVPLVVYNTDQFIK